MRLGQFVTRLHAHPMVGGPPADDLQRERHVGGQARLAVQQAWRQLGTLWALRSLREFGQRNANSEMYRLPLI